MDLVVSDYGDGYTFVWCCKDQLCGLGDLVFDDKFILENVNQREAREFQATHQRARAMAFGS